MPEISESVSIDREVLSHPNISLFLQLLWFLCFNDPLPYIGGRYRWVGRNFNGISEHTVSFRSSKDLILIQLKLMITAHSSGILVSSCLSDIVITTIHSEITRLKKLMMMMIMNKSRETTVFIGRQRLTSTIKLRPEK